jgi:4-carboxymuconolactone decarboxylase
MLTALGKWIELGTHVRGAVRNGVTEVEIREALLQASAYCGMPAGMEAFRVADRVLNEMQERGEMVRG